MKAIRVALASETDFEGWRAQARSLLARAVRPDAIIWSAGSEQDLFDSEDSPAPEQPPMPVRAPSAFIELARLVALHADPERFARLYAFLWRLRSEPRLMEFALDADTARLQVMAKAVSRDRHKMRAFVRFRRIDSETGERYVAWFEPDHHIVEAEAPFFVDRFGGMIWSILTPRASAHWDGQTLSFDSGLGRLAAPDADELDELWRTYYANIFNPARLKMDAMRAEMPKKYWRNLPEARLIAPLAAAARRNSDAMIAAGGAPPNPHPQKMRQPAAAAPAPAPDAWSSLRSEAQACRACPLWEPATQVVFGEGALDAPVMFVGEQPGDQEDLAGRPFVGPAGRLLDQAFGEAGVDRQRAYVTNAVKHFKFEPRGKRRLHKKPDAAEIRACNGWLRREIALVRPRLVVALGATAARALFGRPTSIASLRGRLMRLGEGGQALVTVHPSYLLRLRDGAVRAQAYAQFVADLRTAASFDDVPGKEGVTPAG